MSTSEGSGGDKTPGVTGFSEAELASVTAGPAGDPELEELAPAQIDVQASVEEDEPEKLKARARRLSADRTRTVVESLLFVADRPLTVDQLQTSTGIGREAILKALEKICGSYRDGVSGIVLHEVAGGWQLRTDSGSAEFVRRFLQIKPQRLTRAALETMAIIAYRQPVTRPEVEDIRGVDCGAVVKALLERKLVKILGRKEEVGRPILYGTSREFLEFFALRDLASLPTLREFQELSREHQEIVETQTAEKPAPPSLAQLVDPGFKTRLESSSQDSEAALAELEQAISTADERAKRTAGTLGGNSGGPPGEPGKPG